MSDLWRWAIREAELAERSIPSRLHDEDRNLGPDERPDRRSPGVRTAITGWPFTYEFENFLDSKVQPTPTIRALRKMRVRGRRQSLEYRLCSLVLLRGVRSKEELQKLVGVPSPRFERALEGGLSVLHEISGYSIRQAPEGQGTRKDKPARAVVGVMGDARMNTPPRRKKP